MLENVTLWKFLQNLSFFVTFALEKKCFIFSSSPLQSILMQRKNLEGKFSLQMNCSEGLT